MSTQTLPELVQERVELRDATDAAGGILDEILAAQWEANEEALDAKVKRWGYRLRDKEDDIAILQAHVAQAKKRLAEATARTTAAVNEYERDKAFVQRKLEEAGLTEVKDRLIKVAIEPNNPHVEIADEVDLESLPVEFLRVAPATTAVDKNAILAAHRAGKKLPEGVTVKQDKRLVVK